MKKRFLVTLFFLSSLQACTYLFIGPKLRLNQFSLIHMGGFNDSSNGNYNLIKDSIYFYLLNEEPSIERMGKVLKYYYLIKFFPDGKVGYTSDYTEITHSTIIDYKQTTRPEGYSWGVYLMKGDSIFIEIRARHNDVYHFWAGVVKEDKIYFTHNVNFDDVLDYEFNKILMKQQVIFESKY